MEARGAWRAVFSPCVRRRSRRAMGQRTTILHAPSSGRKRQRVLPDLDPGNAMHPRKSSKRARLWFPHDKQRNALRSWGRKCENARTSERFRLCHSQKPGLTFPPSSTRQDPSYL